VNVKAHDRGTGREQRITIQASSGLNKDQIDRMVKDAEAHASDDRRRREEIEIRNEADNAAYQAEKTLRDLGDKVSSEVKSDVESKISDVRAALGTDDLERMRAAKDALQSAMLKVGEQVYASSAGGSSSGGDYSSGSDGDSSSSSSSSTDDNTVEGEFKEM
jgi:molecular chaperone DnaK